MSKAKSRPCQHPLTAITQVTPSMIHCRKCGQYARLPEVNNGTGPVEEVSEQNSIPQVGESTSERLGGLETDTTHPSGEGEGVEGETEAPARIITVG